MYNQISSAAPKHAEFKAALYVPAPLEPLNQWIGWIAAAGEGKQFRLPNGRLTPESLRRRSKPYKLPINPLTGGLADTTNKVTWGTFQQALQSMHRFQLTGVGFVFTDEDPFTGIDIDNCRDPETGYIDPWAMEIIDAMHSYTEVSPFHCCVKITVIGRIPADQGNQARVAMGKVEMFSRGRYFTWTGLHLEGKPLTIEARQDELMALHSRLFANRNRPRQQNPDRIDSLFRRSGLMREKWEREDNRKRTIHLATEVTNKHRRHSPYIHGSTSSQGLC
jgi:primase-polymerase (primpol)-like protein